MNTDMKEYIDEQIDALTQVIVGKKRGARGCSSGCRRREKTRDRTRRLHASRQYCRIRHTGDDRSTS